ncbi:MAG: diphthamide synthesis protein [Nanoarchaeota archaeon]|nr:diphthamide synthesis protein [Nanoarchaeota archaeon]MBU1632588.1 diphthamide synthesis protein [Nanoarchaeota archaeon]MBU1876518.1 diphthamide synthesis protein [Nanoarchaeota archaeon]
MYELELEEAVKRVKEIKAKIICIQLPDGLKPKAKEIVDKIERETGAKVLIWLGSNFGACDMPLGLEKMKVDLLISWGHNPFNKRLEGW